MNNEQIITSELLEILFNSISDDINLEKIIKNMFYFLRENTYSNNLIHSALLKFFSEKYDYLLSTHNINFSQIKVLLNEIIINNNEKGEESEQVEQVEEESEEIPEIHIPEEELINLNQQNYNLYPPFNFFNFYLNNPINQNVQLINDPFYNFELPPPQFQPNLFNDTFYNALFLNEINISNIEIDMYNILTGNFYQSYDVSIFKPINIVINENELNELKIIKYKDLKEKEKYTECSICLSEFNEETELRLLKCDHGYHKICIDEWLIKYNNNCPVCRNSQNSKNI
jgi:hypothetical protein